MKPLIKLSSPGFQLNFKNGLSFSIYSGYLYPTMVRDEGKNFLDFFSPSACGETWDLDKLVNNNINRHVTQGFLKKHQTH